MKSKIAALIRASLRMAPVTSRHAGLAAILASTISLIGCGGPNTAPVTGVVTLEGNPVYPARVTFSPKAAEGDSEAGGRLSSAMTAPDGSYSIPEATIGENVVGVLVMPADEDSEDAEDDEMPAPPGKPEKTSYNVSSGENTIDIKLTALATGKDGQKGPRDDDDD